MSFYSIKTDMLILNVLLQPNAKKSTVVGVHDERLKIKIAAPATEGKANAELIHFVADWLNLPQSQITLNKGQQSKLKQLIIAPQNPSQQSAILIKLKIFEGT